MGSDKVGMDQVQQQINSGPSSHPHLVGREPFPSDPQSVRRSSTGEPGPKSSATVANFLDHHHFFQHPPAQAAAEFRHQWSRGSATARAVASEDEDDDDDDDDDDAEEEEDDDTDDDNGQESVTVAKLSNTNDVGDFGNQKTKQLAAFVGIKEGNMWQTGNERSENNRNINSVRPVGGGGGYYGQYLHRAEGTSGSSQQKDAVTLENGCGFSGRKESSYRSESGESLKTILLDPITGMLMDDALILPCGHSFSSGGIQQIIRMKACHTCSQPVSEDSIAPNLSLRLAVQAFRREEELEVNRASKRRRERHDRVSHNILYKVAELYKCAF